MPKDGPSAGVTMTCAIASALSGLPVRRDIAMTGEVTLRGRVMAIGGLGKMLKDSLGEEDELGIGDMIKGAFGVAKDALNTKYINAGDYIL